METEPIPDLIPTRKWYVLHVRSNQEKNTVAFLKDRGIEYFLPTYRTISKRADRRVTLIRPLFTSYIFIHVTYGDDERVQALKAPGSVRIVGFGNRPALVDDEVINSLKILVGADENAVKPHPLARIGAKVRVTDGPFTGAIGILNTADRKKPKLIVQVELLGRGVSVPISMDQVQPLFD